MLLLRQSHIQTALLGLRLSELSLRLSMKNMETSCGVLAMCPQLMKKTTMKLRKKKQRKKHKLTKCSLINYSGKTSPICKKRKKSKFTGLPASEASSATVGGTHNSNHATLSWAITSTLVLRKAKRSLIHMVREATHYWCISKYSKLGETCV